MMEEMENHWICQTWKLVPRLKHTNVLGSKWVFAFKTSETGEVKYKARLVAQGFSQRPGIDYFAFFSPVINKDSLRLLISLAINKSWEIHQLDVVAAYLNGHLKETVYMQQPALWEEGGSDTVCLLKKSIYGLHQSGKSWNDTLVQHLREIGLTQCVSDPCVFIHKNGCVGTYVDDMIVCGKHSFVNTVKHALSKKFKVKDLGRISLFLGIRFIQPDCDTVTLDQSDYITETLRKTDMLECNGANTPGPLNLFDQDHCNQPCSAIEYARVLGRLIYISTCTRPDLAFMVSHLSKFCSAPTEGNWINVKRVLRYLKQTVNYKLTYTRDNNNYPVVYSDADYANDPTDSRSVSGYVVIFCSGAIAWRSKKQQLVATSTTIAEYYALFEACREVIWLREVISELTCDIPRPMIVFVDNQSAISLANNGKISDRSKHCRMRYHFIRECVTSKEVELKYVSTSANVADIFTKSLSASKTLCHVLKMGICVD